MLQSFQARCLRAACDQRTARIRSSALRKRAPLPHLPASEQRHAPEHHTYYERGSDHVIWPESGNEVPSRAIEILQSLVSVVSTNSRSRPKRNFAEIGLSPQHSASAQTSLIPKKLQTTSLAKHPQPCFSRIFLATTPLYHPTIHRKSRIQIHHQLNSTPPSLHSAYTEQQPWPTVSSPTIHTSPPEAPTTPTPTPAVLARMATIAQRHFKR